MSSPIDIVSAGSTEIAAPATQTASSVLELMLRDRRSPATQRAYVGDLKLFFAWRGQETTAAALETLTALSTGQLAIVLNEYAASMRSAALSPATINRRLSAVRSLLRLARKFGLTEVDPAGLVDNEKSRAYRDTSGPTLQEVTALLASPDRSTLAGLRDYALLRLMWENALRRGSVCSCSIEHYDSKRRRLSIAKKGWGSERDTITLTRRCANAIDVYLEKRTGGERLDNGSPLFLNHSHSSGKRLSPSGLYYILGLYGLQALDRHLTPHQMRHASPTAYLNATNGDVRGAQKLGGWADVRTAMRYDDDREDRQGKASEVLSKLA